MTNAIETRGLTKTYGTVDALHEMDLQVAEGSIFGFLGPNGAGKTTTLRILTGLARPTRGEARVFGRDVVAATNEVRADVGYLPDVPGYYGWMTALEFLAFTGRLFGLPQRTVDERATALLDLAGLADVETRIAGYSRGMKQRLGIAQALINAPKLLMLDEPTSALDPIGRKEVLDMIGSLGGRTTVFFSTHILSDVERVCDTVAILSTGRVVTQAGIAELKSRYGSSRLVVEVSERADVLVQRFKREAWVTDAEHASNGTISIAVTDIDQARRRVPAIVVEEGVGLVRLESGEVSLEEVFVDLVGGEA